MFFGPSLKKLGHLLKMKSLKNLLKIGLQTSEFEYVCKIWRGIRILGRTCSIVASRVENIEKCNLQKINNKSLLSLWIRLKGPIRRISKNGHWKATGHFFAKIIWKISYTNLDLKVGGRGVGVPPVFPPLRSKFLYRIFHMNSPKKCPVAFQWPVTEDS